MNQIDYSHSNNVHTLEGPRVALPLILELTRARSILDVGCGRAFWLKVARELGISEVFGVDGVPINPHDLLIPETFFQVQDLTQPMQLGRKYDLVLCLEVGEHLDPQFAPVLIGTLTAHSDTVVFSAACPGQEGQHHVNGQWPAYWQQVFNDHGFACFDELRGLFWQDTRIDPWYSQNMFIARRAEAGQAGAEPRIHAMIHPDLVEGIVNTKILHRNALAEAGGMPFIWYLKLPFSALAGRLRQMLHPANAVISQVHMKEAVRESEARAKE